MKKIILILTIVIILFLLFYYFLPKLNHTQKETTEIFIGNVKIQAEISDTPQKMEIGLSGRNNLEENKGMLFYYKDPGIYSFWMKNMNFPLDIIWIGNNNKIIDITKSVLPESYPKKITPREPVKYVIETNSGWCNQNKINIGDIVTILYEYENQAKLKSDLIIINNPKIGEIISSPLNIEGRARGSWFFEASFPIKIIDSKGNELVTKPATATSDWMTNEFVPFRAYLEFNIPKKINTGFLILKKDNPSGLPEKNDEIKIPIRFH